MLRRRPFALPQVEQLPALIAVLQDTELVAPEDPPRFVEAVVAHRIVGAAATALDANSLVLPSTRSQELRDAEGVGVLRSAMMRRELGLIAEPVSEAIEALPIVLKGPAIADRFYPDPRLRSFGDLDLLVPRERLGDAVATLEALGYEESVELREGFGATHGHDVHMSRSLGRHRTDVELHWRVGDDALGQALAHEALVDRAVPAGSDRTSLYPSTGDQLLVCSMHLLSDRLKRLAWIEDLRRISLGLDEDAWREAFERAGTLGLLWVLNRALDYAAHHLDYRRARPLPAGEPPRWGPIRAVEELDLRASLHLGRLAALPWRRRPRYLRHVLLPSRAGLRGTVGADGAGRVRMALRHLTRIARGATPHR
ncbi:MAG: nucleotidyltransferase family protein [Solirubrobacterales bacterium]